MSGDGSNVWEFVPSGTMQVRSAFTPTTYETMLVIWACVVPIRYQRSSRSRVRSSACQVHRATRIMSFKITPKSGVTQKLPTSHKVEYGVYGHHHRLETP